MLRRKLCEAVFTWELTCEGPLLIADGRYLQKEVTQAFDTNPDEKKKRKGWYPDKFFINKTDRREMIEGIRTAGRTPPGGAWNYYVPGSSIRGPFRSTAERIIRTLMPEDAQAHLTACDPFEQEDGHQTLSCSKRLEKDTTEKSAYAVACPACKLFGCAGLASRINFTDAAIAHTCKSVYRDMIGIDRFTGGVYSGAGGANMRFHALENTSFTSMVTLVNFELWQLGLLAYVFRDFEEGLVPIGYGKTKGFGHVKGSVSKIKLTYPVNPSRVEHLGSLISSPTEREHYGINMFEPGAFNRFSPESNGLSLFHSVIVSDLQQFWETVAPSFNSFIELLNVRCQEARQ